jgi:hypothetical protein
MYDVSITNNYFTGFFIDGGNQVFGPGGTYEFKDWGTHTVQVYGMGDILFIDIGDRKLPAYTNPKIPWTEKTWGGVIRYRGLDAYFRYEGQGKVQVEIDSLGSINVRFDQGGMMISLADFVV